MAVSIQFKITLLLEDFQHVFSQQAFSKLIQHSWPGNIQELKNCIQLAVALSSNGPIDVHQIYILRRRAELDDIKQPELIEQKGLYQPPRRTVESEKALIQELIIKFQGNRKLIATEIGVSERTLYRKLNQYQLG